jgi:hypothetical protein
MPFLYFFLPLIFLISFSIITYGKAQISLQSLRLRIIWIIHDCPETLAVEVARRRPNNAEYILWFSGQSSWLQIQRSRVRFPVVGLERGPLSQVRIIEELLEWKSSGSGLEKRD